MDIYIKDLVQIGLSELEAKIYLNLMKKRNFTATEIATAAGINRTQTYDILAKLVKRGMCVEIFGNVKKYEAIPPNLVMEKISRELDIQKTITDKLAKSLEVVFRSNNNIDNPLDFIKVLRTDTSIREHIFNLIDGARESVMVFNKPPYAMNPDSNEPEARSLKKGVRHSSIYEIEYDNMADFSHRIKHFQSQGEEVRLIDKLPMKLVIFDRRTVVLTLQNVGKIGTMFTVMSVEHADFAQAMQDIFSLYWQNAMTLEDFRKIHQKEGEEDEKS